MVKKDLLENLNVEDLKEILENLGVEFKDSTRNTGVTPTDIKDRAVGIKGETLASAKLKKRLNGGYGFRETELSEVEEGYNFYAIAARTGYGLYNSASNCANQLNYYRDADWKGFEYADDAMAWIINTVPGKAHIRSHEFCSLDYMLKHQNYWFSKGKEE